MFCGSEFYSDFIWDQKTCNNGIKLFKEKQTLNIQNVNWQKKKLKKNKRKKLIQFENNSVSL